MMDKRNSYTDESQRRKCPATPDNQTVNIPVKMTETTSIPHTKATFMAFVDAVIPSTLGALDLQLDDYLITTLDRYLANPKTYPLSAQIASLLDIAAFTIIHSQRNKVLPDYLANPDGGPFAALSPEDRFEAIRLLESLQVDLEILPNLFQNNAGFIQYIITTLHTMVTFGYYSEWFSLGPTRFAYPEDHCFERQPFLWEKLNYPGPSFGYRAIRS